MKRLVLRKEVVRVLDPVRLREVNGGQVNSLRGCTTAISCTDLLGCSIGQVCLVIGPSLQGCTTAVNCP